METFGWARTAAPSAELPTGMRLRWGLFHLRAADRLGTEFVERLPALERRIAHYAVLSLTLVRMIPVAIALLGTKLRRESVLFLGWLGPWGLASVVLGNLVLILWRLIRLAARKALDRAAKTGRRKQSESLITLLVWGLRLVVIIVATVRSVEGVQGDREIDALLMQFTENQMVFRVGWWIASYEDFFPVHNRVSRAVIQAPKEANVVLPYTTGSVRVEMNQGEA